MRVTSVPSWRRTISSAVESLISECAPLRFPVDLTRLAVRQGIVQIHFRPMPCDGAIEVKQDGFVVHMKAAKEQIVPAETVASSKLSPRQRFTFAHEISHTF